MIYWINEESKKDCLLLTFSEFKQEPCRRYVSCFLLHCPLEICRKRVRSSFECCNLKRKLRTNLGKLNEQTWTLSYVSQTRQRSSEKKKKKKKNLLCLLTTSSHLRNQACSSSHCHLGLGIHFELGYVTQRVDVLIRGMGVVQWWKECAEIFTSRSDPKWHLAFTCVMEPEGENMSCSETYVTLFIFIKAWF